MDSSTQYQQIIPTWAMSVLVCPRCKGNLSSVDNLLCCDQCGSVGRWLDGIASFGIPNEDASISWYKSKGGASFYERRQIPFTMTSLDTPVYHDYLERLKPNRSDSIIVDVGAGDGRNTEPWLTWGYQRIIAVDAIFASLARFQHRLRDEHPEWLDCLLLVECDARQLPIASASADLVFTIETLCCLNEDYELGLAECRRVLNQAGRIMVSERAWEGALLTRLLYGGLEEMMGMRFTRDSLDGPPGNLVRTRTFTKDELIAAVERAGLIPLEQAGLSVLSIVLGYLRGEGKLPPEDEQHLPAVYEFLKSLGETGQMRRSHVIVAKKQPNIQGESNATGE